MYIPTLLFFGDFFSKPEQLPGINNVTLDRKFQLPEFALYFSFKMPLPSIFHKIVPKFARQIAPHIPLVAFRRLFPRSPIGFFYHAVSDDPLPHVKHLYSHKSIAEFEQDIRYLKQHFTLVGYPMRLSFGWWFS